jgi:hypothetical protein
MKFTFGPRFVALCGAFAAAGFAQNPESSSPESRPAPASDQPASSTQPPALSRAEALKVIAGARQYVAHPTPTPAAGAVTKPQVTTPDFAMDTPPPAPRPETKPGAPAEGMVWVAGHYMPVKGEWRWVNGEWAVPATPISVWIPARYDAEQKKWAPGYWQPDAPTTPPAEPATKPVTPAAPASPY